MLGDAFCDAYDEGDFGFYGFFNACRGEGWSDGLLVLTGVWSRGSVRDEYCGRGCSSLFNGIADLGEYGLSEMLLPGFLWVRAADDIGACLLSTSCCSRYCTRGIVP